LDSGSFGGPPALLGTLVALTNFFAQALKHDASPTERDKKTFR
jgi:hypothetical protein